MQNDNQTSNRKALDNPSFTEHLANKTGRQYWRGLEEIAETTEFREMVDREFPEGASEWLDPVGRRNFLKLMGASLALAGIGACAKQPEEKIVPYVKQPEEFVPGKPSFFATAMPLRGYATGLLVESHLGRPTKVEGNPDHPASLGATDAITQASILGLYDPDRSQTVLSRSRIASWDSFKTAIAAEVGAWKAAQGTGLHFLTETISSPTLADQMRQLMATYPNAVWHQYEPAGRDCVREGAKMAFGQYVETTYRFDKAEVIFSIDADFLLTMPGSVRYSRDFSTMRRTAGEVKGMNRLYALESSPSVTGAVADHRAALAPAAVEQAAWAVGAALGVPGVSAQGSSPAVDALGKAWIPSLVKDLQAHRGRCVVVAGDEQSPAVHALAHAMNAALGNVGTTVVYTDPVEANPTNQAASLGALMQQIDSGKVDTLVVLGGNPAFTAPADLKFAERYQKVRLRIHAGDYNDETAYLSHWHLPLSHYLENWSDARAMDGTVSIVQPLVAPLWDSKSLHEVVSILNGTPSATAYDIVRAYWQGAKSAPAPAAAPTPGDSTAAHAAPAAMNAGPVASIAVNGDFERGWHQALYRGIVAGSALPPKSPTLNGGWATAAAALLAATPAGADAFDIVFRVDPMLLDGRFANIGWLQEAPKPLTKLVWDNALLVSPATAKQRGWKTEDVVEVGYKNLTVKVPVWEMPGHADGCGTLYLGHGRTRSGRVGNDVGVNVYAIRTSDAPWRAAAATANKTGDCYLLVTTQTHYSMEGRDIVRHGTLAEFMANEKFMEERHHEPEIVSLYKEHTYKGHAWGMAIDLTACTACNACVVACQSENNIPVVGKEQVNNGRAMHWIRIDRYYEGDAAAPAQHFQPLPCMHCEKAPCETVCPVGATVHGEEGLNEMVYNRCIGTRYCSNNCPYKVRRFNYLLFSDLDTPSFKMMRNPDVTVRSRGVMEKCTYCVQRINSARIEAKKEGRMIRDGEVVTACAQVCPTEAITFGNINDKDSRVAKAKKSPLNYALLGDLGTAPRTTYLTKLRNPNPELEKGA
ncbi:MAG: TAT-variant-translocated molybdopterin oxidoreductase [Bacteroidetes bacterium]|nr:TAT-variant-translocated molybdopterin oxidoreductase [Bacteroidota bacterium]